MMIYVDRTKYDRTKSVVFSKFKRLPPANARPQQVRTWQPEADAIATKFGAGRGGTVPESVAAKHGPALPAVDDPDVRGSARRPAGIGSFSPGKVHHNLRGRGVSSVCAYATAINGHWHRGVEAFIQIGHLCAEANEGLTTAQKSELVHALPFGNSAFSKFVQIGSDTRLYAPELQALLPPHYTTLYAVTSLTDEELKEAIAEKVLNSDTTRAQLQKWQRELSRKVELAPRPDEAEIDVVVALPTTQTQEAGALRATVSDDTREKQDERAADPKYAPAPGPVATGAETKGQLTPPPGDDDIPAFLDRRPLAPGNQRAYDAIKATWNSHVLPLWKSASAVVRERIIAEVIRANPSG
jgi:hypothetical protein